MARAASKESLPSGKSLSLAGWCLAHLGVNAMQAALATGVPDRGPLSQRAAVSG